MCPSAERRLFKGSNYKVKITRGICHCKVNVTVRVMPVSFDYRNVATCLFIIG